MVEHMGSRRTKAILGTVALVLALAGCSNSEAGTPVATNTPGGTTGTARSPGETSATRPSNRYGAPRVAQPLDVTKFLAQPCAALTAQQLQNLNLPAQGKADTDSPIAKNSGPSCDWINSDTATSLGLSFTTGNKNGLADLYRANDEGKWTGYWAETTVSGYPGVFHGVTDARAQGSCNLAVGVSETLTFLVDIGGRMKEQSCDFAKQVAAAVAETVKAGG
jgi:hypothetical protein